jgi:antibiotic biosynthesis monooxygenase
MTPKQKCLSPIDSGRFAHMFTRSHICAHAQTRSRHFNTLLRSLLLPTRQESGCVRFVLLPNREAPTKSAIVSEWRSEQPERSCRIRLCSAGVKQIAITAGCSRWIFDSSISWAHVGRKVSQSRPAAQALGSTAGSAYMHLSRWLLSHGAPCRQYRIRV